MDYLRNSSYNADIINAEELVPFDENDFEDRDQAEIFMRTKVKEFNRIK
jgi:hypothetical protein